MITTVKVFGGIKAVKDGEKFIFLENNGLQVIKCELFTVIHTLYSEKFTQKVSKIG